MHAIKDINLTGDWKRERERERGRERTKKKTPSKYFPVTLHDY